MFALRRASIPLQFRYFGSSYRGVNCIQSELLLNRLQLDPKIADAEFISNSRHNLDFSLKRYSISSQTGSESNEAEDDFENGHDGSQAAKADERNAVAGNEEWFVLRNELEGSEDDGGRGKLGENDKMLNKEMELFKAIIADPKINAFEVLNKWVEEGKQLERVDISVAIANLRKRRLFSRALQIFRWLENNNRLEFNENDYASRLDLIAKLRGVEQAEKYIEKIPETFRTEVVYRTLLANCVVTKNLKKAEELFDKMKRLKLPITTFTYNQLLLLYKWFNPKKLHDMLLLMDKENVEPSLLTYKIVIDSKGRVNDIGGMEQVYELMKAKGIEPDIGVKAILVRHYLSSGLKDKARALLREMEGGNLNEHQWDCSLLLPLYAELGAADEVERVWKVCESNPRIVDCDAAIEAWGSLKKIDKAEAVFEKMLSRWKDVRPKHYTAMLKVYASHKMLGKGKNLVKQMAGTGSIEPWVLNEILKLYVAAGEVEKADLVLKKAIQQKQMTPLRLSYVSLLEQYSKRGDIYNTEKMFHWMKQAGYTPGVRQFETLLEAYINGKAPAYGMMDRLNANNVYPNRNMAAQLAKVDPFKRTTASDLLE